MPRSTDPSAKALHEAFQLVPADHVLANKIAMTLDRWWREGAESGRSHCRAKAIDELSGLRERIETAIDVLNGKERPDDQWP